MLNHVSQSNNIYFYESRKELLVKSGGWFLEKNDSSFLKLDFLFAENFNYVFLVNSQHSLIQIFKHSLEITEGLPSGGILELDLCAKSFQ